VVILKKFKRHVTSGHNLSNFSGYFETGDGFTFFKPFSANEVFQMLGRAGRPGLDSVGYGIILVKNLEERIWVEDHFFNPLDASKELNPRYNNLTSTLNDMNILKEQVLLRVYEERKISLPQLIQFFERTYFFYEFQNSNSSAMNKVPIEQLLMIKEIEPLNLLKMHSCRKNPREIKEKIKKIKLTSITEVRISGYLQTQFGVFECSFDVKKGIYCSCGYKNGISDNFGNTKYVFEFCDHAIAFLIYLIQCNQPRIQKYVEDIIPKAVREQYILNYLLEKGLLTQILTQGTQVFQCTAFGKLVIRLYIDPASAVLIREKLEKKSFSTYIEILKEAFDVLKKEGKVRREEFFEPLLDWSDEVSIEKILDKYSMMAGDLYSLIENICRVIMFIHKIAEYLSNSGTDLREKMINLMEMTETLNIRIEHGVKEELFDLVIRLNQVGRMRARILFNAGYRNASEVKNENPYILNKKTGIGLNLCKKIVVE